MILTKRKAGLAGWGISWSGRSSLTVRSFLLSLLLLLLAQFGQPALCLDIPARVYGFVLDHQTGKRLSGARIEVPGFSAVSDAQGRFTFPVLGGGSKLFKVTLEGYEDLSRVVQLEETPQALVLDMEPLERLTGDGVITADPYSKPQQEPPSGMGNLVFYEPDADDQPDKYDLDPLEQGVKASVRKNLFARITAERLHRKRELMRDWFKPDDNWWKQLAQLRDKERSEKSLREAAARERYLAYLRESLANETRDEMVDRLMREARLNNVNYALIPQEFYFTSFDLRVKAQLGRIMDEEFISDYASSTVSARHSTGMTDVEIPLFDPARRYCTYLPAPIAAQPREIRAITQAGQEEETAVKTGRRAVVQVVNGKTGAFLDESIVVLTDSEGTKSFLVTDRIGEVEIPARVRDESCTLEVSRPLFGTVTLRLTPGEAAVASTGIIKIVLWPGESGKSNEADL